MAMLAGILCYPVFIRLAFLTPAFIFAMLLLTFCKVSPSGLKPRRLHFWLLLIQLGGALLVYISLRSFSELWAQAVMVCVICPTATSAAIITAKLGGSAASVSSYVLLANVGVAVVVPLFFPLIGSHPEVPFMQSFMLILSRVALLLICPILLAWFLRHCLPRVHATLTGFHELAFYLWAIALCIVTSQIMDSLLNQPADLFTTAFIAVLTLIVCCLQFYVGKRLGSIYNDRISGGQSLGQKNTVLAIWMAHTYLNPLAAIGPGFYVLWQNMINSWQLWKKRRLEERGASDITSSEA